VTGHIVGGKQQAAAFFDLYKTIIAKSSTLAYGPSFYRHGLITRADAIRSAAAQLLFTRHGASHQRMERIKNQVTQVCRGWPVLAFSALPARMAARPQPAGPASSGRSGITQECDGGDRST
jgi:hypothetical protein